ncbi:TPA: Cop-6 protein [Staphylococcus aureus]|uniref:Cop-6 protein n=1 Tax=Staphylococcus aureus TaxID=1280 RepID=UPI00064CD169|nr:MULTISPECIES: Cop-6 protein [Bacteria]MDV7975300.1 Cop-6 protein [Pseudomonas aeruginosa]MRM07291.1 Cop-6 protein [Staphylococcus aureus]CAC5903231.1 Cop-6 protein [Staphylococcus aureus]CXI37008.1 Cop-6 protein [Staphylococcus aureus]CXU95162.1 Cop-6 protein [Staphylococcus aureus]
MNSVQKSSENKKTVSLRLEENSDVILNRIKNKYGISKSEVVETLIKKYAREEYGSF